MPASNAETFVKAAELLFGETGRAGSVSVENGKLIIETSHRQIGHLNSISMDLDDMDKFIRELDAKPKIADEPYIAAVEVLERLGASAEHIKGGFKRNEDGEVYLSEVTMGKEGKDSIRVYTRCRFEMDLKHLDHQKAATMLEENDITEAISRHLSPLRNLGERRHNMHATSAHRKVELPLGTDYSDACARLAFIKMLLEEETARHPTTLDMHSLLPDLPPKAHGREDYELVLDFKDKLPEAKFFLEAVKPIREKLRQEEIVRTEAKLPEATKKTCEYFERMLEDMFKQEQIPSFVERHKGGIYRYRAQLKGVTDERFRALTEELSLVFSDTKKKGGEYTCRATFKDVPNQDGVKIVDVTFIRMPVQIRDGMESEPANIAEILGHIAAMSKALKTPLQKAR